MSKFLDELIDDIAYPLMATGTHNNIGETTYDMIGRKKPKATTSYKVATDSDVSDVASSVASNSSAIASVASSVKANSSAIESVAGSVKANSSAISSVASSVASNSSAISSVAGSVKANSSAIVSVVSSVASNSSAIASTVAANSSAFSSVAGSVASISSSVASLASGGGGSSDPAIAAEIPDITGGSSFTDEQMNYWRQNVTSYTTQTMTWSYQNQPGVTADMAPTTSNTYSGQPGGPQDQKNFLVAYIMVWDVPSWVEKPTYGPGIRRLELEYAQKAQPILRVLRLKTSDGTIYNHYKNLTDGSPVAPGSEVMNFIEFAGAALQSVTVTATAPTVSDVTTKHHAIDFSDDKVNYNNLIPQVFLMAYGDWKASYQNGVYSVTTGTSGGFYVAVYVGTFLSPYVVDSYNNYSYHYMTWTNNFAPYAIKVNIQGTLVNVANQIKFV